MEKFKAQYRTAMLEGMRAFNPNMSNQQLEIEYRKFVFQLKTAGCVCVAGLVGYFAGKRK